MPHGDYSDYASYFSLAFSLASYFYPQFYYQPLGPFSPLLPSGSYVEGNGESILIRTLASVFLFLYLVLYVNRWNTLTGKAGGLGSLAISLTSLYTAYLLDGADLISNVAKGEVRMWVVISGVFVIAAAHLSFNANESWTSGTLKEHEVKMAEKKRVRLAKEKEAMEKRK